jgi:2-keto-4-pentenoate hydratase/2-oxohepta-3-ene-1,7-dioic acid hydratase in catechol pathway
MKLATVHHGNVERIGVIDPAGAAIRLVEGKPATVLDVIRAGIATPDALTLARPIPLADVRLRAPIPLPVRNIFCVGKNYFEHAHEFAKSGFDSSAAQGAVPQAPIVFSKVPQSVIGPGDDIQVDHDVSAATDYEVELAVIIGKGGRRITKANALAHVWGYTIVNDVTARDLQGRYSQWLIGKSQDTFCPMGPYAVTADAIDLANTTVKTWVNGELRQNSNTKDLIFDVPTLIETISAGVTLLPGDIIATGTPVGVGIGFKPPRYLAPGDVVRLEISGIGTLENKVAQRIG